MDTLEIGKIIAQRRQELALTQQEVANNASVSRRTLKQNVSPSDTTAGYVLRELAKDSHAWRIDWFGATTYAERYRRSSQPLIDVQISQVPEGITDFHEFFGRRKSQWPNTRRLRLPVGFLPMLKIGDIWRDGKRCESPDYEIATFAELETTRDVCTLIKAGLPDEATGQYFLPLDIHPYHVKFTQSYCLHIEHSDGSIVIPCTELLRFYFGSTSTLVSRLFDAPFKQENFWIDHQMDGTGSAKIHLASGMSGRSATDIGRITFSKTGRQAAELVGNSCIAATARGESAYVKAMFPFSGKTNLSASGIWLPFNGKERGVFLVFRLRSCSHRFPFSRLHYTSECVQARSTKTTAGAAWPAPDASPAFSRQRRDSKLLSDREPDKSKQPRKLDLASEEMQFPDLARKPVSRVDSEVTPTIRLSQQGMSIINSSSVGCEGSMATIQPIELSVADAGTLTSNITTSFPHVVIFYQVLQYLAKQPGFLSVDVVRLSPRQRHDHLSMMPRIVDEDGELLDACVIAQPAPGEPSKVSTRNRHISVARAQELHRTCYLLIPEPDDKESFSLHAIMDCSRGIRTTDDLLGAIALHFSTPSSWNAALQLNEGVTSAKFVTNESRDSAAEKIADELWAKMDRFIHAGSR
ncbi:helix-turn-helix domain-containing protein [Pseudoduganella violacea]|uniref:Transcriptional regulator with XRE-family HTH domain n=1 Tax=Pseudoduganella violacea TaxID=1715466 RepID=A0A7W5BG33_9BURK|nr:helix-turn-helix domain-containing protein [Pseudoduganella violacea]MBB3122488.1 transcriptional regulator with XRE-family HTH domain [Pseudoduganella violacea]